MIYKASLAFSDALILKPETGMGYQVINAIRAGRSYIEKFVVYNSMLIIEDNSDFLMNKRQVVREGFSTILNKASLVTLSLISVIPKNEIKEFRLIAESKRTSKGRIDGGIGAKDAKKEYANGHEAFVRLSAYEDDKRIDFINKKLKPGSYTTTMEDYLTCRRYNDDPIDRYALPNDEEIKWTFHIQPKSTDQLQRGIVQPAFGHDGGGIEAYFENGTSNDTYLHKLLY